MPTPVEVDIVAGIGGERASFHLEVMAHIDPYEFVEAVQAAVRAELHRQVPRKPQVVPIPEVPVVDRPRRRAAG